jgi:hypothetical protein
MFHYQDVITRLRRNEGRRTIQAALRMGPRKIDEIRRLAMRMGWLDPETKLPTQEEITAALDACRKLAAQQVSKVEPYRDLVLEWLKSKMEAQTIWSATHNSLGSLFQQVKSSREMRPAIEGMEASRFWCISVLHITSPGNAPAVAGDVTLTLSTAEQLVPPPPTKWPPSVPRESRPSIPPGPVAHTRIPTRPAQWAGTGRVRP